MHPSTLFIAHNLAINPKALRRYEEAEKLASRAMTSRLQVLGKDHKDNWNSAALLGNILYGQGKFDAAVKVEQQALEGRETLLGPMHPDMLGSAHNLALSLRDLGRHEDAEALAYRAMTSRLEVLGKDDEDTWNSARPLDGLFDLQGKEDSDDVVGYVTAIFGVMVRLLYWSPLVMGIAMNELERNSF